MSGGLFGEKKNGEAFGGLFSKPSAIDGESLVREKQEKLIQGKKEEKKQREEKEGEDKMEVDEEPVVEVKEVKKSKKKSDGGNLEDEYMRKLVESDEDDEDEDEEDEDKEEKDSKADEDADANLEAKIIDLKQKEFDNAEKTVFIGNVPTTVMASKKDTKDFKRFINESLEAPEGENLIQSIRFRSLHSNTNAPKKVAFISKEINMESSMVSYVVFKSKDVSLKAVKLNGKIYKENHLRFDHLTHPSKKDNKLSVFVGNVSFEETEEKLWRYFNKALGGEEVVENVRIVRDPKTSFGKGFAILQFTDSNYVSKALLLNNKKMNGRPLRVTRCKKMKRNNDMVRKKTEGMNDRQKTIIGRAKVLNKSDRNTIGRLVLEGERAKAGSKPGVKKPRHKKRLTKRSQAFKEGK